MNNKEWYIKKNSLAITVYIMNEHKLTDDLEKALSFQTKSEGILYLKENKMSLCSCENKLVEL